MKKIIKYMLFILAVFLINISNINAEEYKGVIEKGEAIEGIFYYKTREDSGTVTYPTHSFHEQAHFYYDSINHNVVYCIESWKPITGATTGDFSVFDGNVEQTNLTDKQIEEINLISYYGYGYKDDNYDHTAPEWYAITQMLIWKLQAPNYKHYIVDSITSTKPNYMYDSQMNEIKKLVTKHKNKPSLFNSEMIINKTKESQDISGNLKYYEVDSCDDGISVSIEGDKAVIKSLNKIGKFDYTIKRKNNRWNKKMKIYISDNYQNIFEPGDMEENVLTKKVTVKGYKLKYAVYSVIPRYLNEAGKEVYTTHFFPDVEIALIVKKDIYDGAGNLVYEKGSTYSKVKSTSNYSSVSVPSGTFELQVVSKIPGFKSSPKVVKVDDADVTAGISLKKSTFVINVYKNSEKVQDTGLITKEPGKNITFGLYAGEDVINLSGELFIKNDRLIKTLETDELGKISQKEPFLLPGRYYLKEITELDNYETNDQKYEINLAYGSEYEDFIDTEEILVENKLKTGKLSIKKLDADDYYPLENVTYSLYSKDNSLIETKSTDSNGEVEFDIKIGEYYIKENKALDGYIRDDKIYYVKIDYTNLNPSYKLLNEKIIKDDKLPSDEDEPKDEPSEEPDKPVVPEEPKEELDKPNDSNEETETPTKTPENPQEPEKQHQEIEKIEEEENKTEVVDQELNKGEELIVNVPSTNVYDYFSILLFLLSITIISFRKCLEE